MLSLILQKIPIDIKNRFSENDLREFILATLKKNNYKLGQDIFKYEFLSKGYKTVLHGAGLHTIKILERLEEKYKNNIIAIIDEKKCGLKLDNFLVYNPRDSLYFDVDYFILSSDINQNSMRKELLKFGVSKDKIVDLYRNENIINYVFLNIETVEIANQINALSKPLTIASNCIVAKHIKLFKFLRRYFDLTIITSYIEQEELFLKYDNLNIKLLESSAKIVDCVSRIKKGIVLTINGVFWNSLGSLITLVSKVPTYALFVDILSSGYKQDIELNKYCDNAQFEFLAEEILWRCSDGVIFKEHLDLAKNNIEKYAPKSYIQFLDYCDDEVVINKTTDDTNYFSFVYAGGLHSDPKYNPDFYHHSTILEVAKTLNYLGHRFVIFNAYDKTGVEKQYYLSYKHPLYSYNGAIAICELPHKICDYDFGVVLFDFSVEGVEEKEYYKKGGFSKLAAYIEAEIPIIISKETEFMASIVTENDIGLAIEFNDISNINSYITYDKIQRWRENIKKFKREFSYSKNIKSLYGFLTKSFNSSVF